MSELLPGSRVGPWVVQEVLGEGATAAVYRVEHAELGAIRALKVSTTARRALAARLRAEGQFLSRLAHRNIVEVHDVLDVDGRPALLMDWVRGPTLADILAAGPLDRDAADRLARGILSGVAAVHAAGLVHRDLKPANVLVSIEEEGLVPRVADFGLAKDLWSGTSATGTGAVLGTPSYMSPEQIRDPRSVDARSDVFSLGAILYELVTGRKAFEDDDLLQVFNLIASAERAPIDPALAPAPWLAAIDAALRVDREQRPADARALLAVWADGEVSLGPSAPIVDRVLVARARSLVPGQRPKTPAPGTTAPGLTPDALPRASSETLSLGALSGAVPVASGPAAPVRIEEAHRARSGSWWLAGGLAAALLLGCGGVGLLGAGWAWLGSSTGAGMVAVPVLIPTPVSAPSPAPAEPPSIVEPPPIAAPPVAAPPLPVAAPPPVAEPPPREERIVAPAPVEAPTAEPPAPPPAPTKGQVTLQGQGVRVLLRSDRGSYPVPGEAEPGTYTILAMFADDEVPREMGSAEVSLGKETVIRCQMNRCVAR